MSASQKNSSELPSPRAQPLSIVSAILGECLCDPFTLPERGLDVNRLFIQLRGIEFISLGAVVDELSAKQRIKESVQRLLSSKTDRLINIGFLLDDESNKILKITQSIPLYIWAKSYPNDNNLNTPLQRTINAIKVRYSVEPLTTLSLIAITISSLTLF